MNLKIGKGRQNDMNKATSQLKLCLDILVEQNVINDYKITEDSQSLTDIQDGVDFEFLANDKWYSASSKIDQSIGYYLSMREKRNNGTKTELEKRLFSYFNGDKNPDFMFNFFFDNNKPHHCYWIRTSVWLDCYLELKKMEENGNDKIKEYRNTIYSRPGRNDGCAFMNIPAKVLRIEAHKLT